MHGTVLLVDEQLARRPAPCQPLCAGHGLAPRLVDAGRGGDVLPVGLLGMHGTVLLVDEQLARRPVPCQLLCVGYGLALSLVYAGGSACSLGPDLPPTVCVSAHVVGRPLAHPPRGPTLCLEGLVPLHPSGRLAY